MNLEVVVELHLEFALLSQKQIYLFANCAPTWEPIAYNLFNIK